MPSFDPNIMLGILQGMQSGEAFPTSVPGLPERMMPRLERRLGNLSPDQIGTLTTGFETYAPTWQQGQQWGRQDILGASGFGGGPSSFGGGNGGMGGRMGGILGGRPAGAGGGMMGGPAERGMMGGQMGGSPVVQPPMGTGGSFGRGSALGGTGGAGGGIRSSGGK